MKIGIIVGSVREGRKGRSVGDWVLAEAQQRNDAEYTILDVKAFDLPFQTSATPPAAAKRQYADPRVTAWSEAIDAQDAYVFVTAEYNHGVPGAFKNAVDLIAPEWMGKAIGFVSYGSMEGVRSVEQWRQIIANFNMYDIRSQVSASIFTDFEKDGTFTPNERKAASLKSLLDDLIATAKKVG